MRRAHDFSWLRTAQVLGHPAQVLARCRQRLRNTFSAAARLWRWRQTWRVRLFFAAVGALLWGVAALGFDQVLAGLDLPRAAATQNTPALLFNSQPRDETERRLRRERALRGEFEVSLEWNSKTDLDLHIIEPSGEHISFFHRHSATGGLLDVDENVLPRTLEPIEHVVWPAGDAPPGRYQVWVHHYRWHSGSNPTPFLVQIRRRRASGDQPLDTPDDVRRVRGVATFGQAPLLVATFAVTPRPALPWKAILKRLRLACGRAAALIFSLNGLQLIILSALWSLAGASALACGFVLVEKRVFGGALRGTSPLASTWGVLPRAAWAGIAGQSLCVVTAVLDATASFSEAAPSSLLARWIGLTALATIVAGRLSRTVPYLPRPLALLSSVAGAMLGSLALAGGEQPDRILAAAILGAAIGLAITPPARAGGFGYWTNLSRRSIIRLRGRGKNGHQFGGYTLDAHEMEALTITGLSEPACREVPCCRR